VIPTSDLERFISDFEESLAPVEKAADEAWWILATSGPEGASEEFVAAGKTYSDLFSDPDEYQELRDLFEDIFRGEPAPATPGRGSLQDVRGAAGGPGDPRPHRGAPSMFAPFCPGLPVRFANTSCVFRPFSYAATRRCQPPRERSTSP
jgi:hypothetical protein